MMLCISVAKMLRLYSKKKTLFRSLNITNLQGCSQSGKTRKTDFTSI